MMRAPHASVGAATVANQPLAPGAVIGILGGGQLGRMLSLAASRLGIRSHIVCPDPHSPAFEVTNAHSVVAYDDWQALEQLAERFAVVTYEFENIPGETAEFFAARDLLVPGANALIVSQDRLNEKKFFSAHDIPVVPYRNIDSPSALDDAVAQVGIPGVLKTRRLGYDGKGQYVIRRPEDAAQAWQALGSGPTIYEAWVQFSREISVITARGRNGDVKCYDPTENEHRNHILHRSQVPAEIEPELAESAREIATRITQALDYVGVLAVEFFVIGQDDRHRLVVNEIAPRVHNSGHWTMDGCAIGQFEQHIRAISGWPLGDTERFADVEMTNIIGDEYAEWLDFAARPHVKLHLYGKTAQRPGRKMGHANRLFPLGTGPGSGRHNTAFR